MLVRALSVLTFMFFQAFLQHKLLFNHVTFLCYQQTWSKQSMRTESMGGSTDLCARILPLMILWFLWRETWEHGWIEWGWRLTRHEWLKTEIAQVKKSPTWTWRNFIPKGYLNSFISLYPLISSTVPFFDLCVFMRSGRAVEGGFQCVIFWGLSGTEPATTEMKLKSVTK